MIAAVASAAPDAATDPRIDPQVRIFLAKLNKDGSPFWELSQPKPQEILTELQNKTPVDMSGVTTIKKTIFEISGLELGKQVNNDLQRVIITKL